MHKQGGKSLSHHLQAVYCQHHAISAVVDSQIARKMPELGYPLSKGNRFYILLGEAFITAKVFHNLSLDV